MKSIPTDAKLVSLLYYVCNNLVEILSAFGLSTARYYINYKLMKKMLKQYVEQTQHGGKDREQVLKEFSRILDDQVYK
jgi:hypothetical protein